MRIKIISLFLVMIYSFCNFGYTCEEFETTRTNKVPVISSTISGLPEIAKGDQFYLILSVRSPAKIPLHTILEEVPAENLLLIAGSKFFTQNEAEVLSQSFNTIIRVDNYRDSGNLEAALYKLYQKKPFQKIIAYHEYDLLRAAKIRDFFNLPGQNYQSAITFRDKILMKSILSKAGIKVPSFARIDSPFDVLSFTQVHGFPAVVKPIFGTGADGVFILKNSEEAEEFIGNYKGFNDRHLTDVEIESFVDGTTYHIDGFIKDGKIIASWPSICMNHCVDLKKGSYVAHHHLSPQNQMLQRLNEYTKAVLEVLPSPTDSAFLLEIFYNKSRDEIIFCEIAARIGGGVKEMWPEAFDIDLENEFIRMQAGLKLSSKLVNFLDSSNNFPSSIKSISGWIIFPKPLDILVSIPETTPFPWVKEYIVRANPGILTLPTKNVSDSLASAFIVSDSEEQFEERAQLLNDWLQNNTKWKKALISPNIVRCIEDCEECTEQCEKSDCKITKNCISKCNVCLTETKRSPERSLGTATIQDKDRSERERYRLWYDGGCCKGECTTQLSTHHPISQGAHEEEFDRYKLFGSTFLSGAAYSLVPEVFRDVLESRGYSSQTASIAATIIQGGMIAYNTSSYAPIITGMAVKTGFSQLGFSPQSSAIAGSTAAIIASFSQKLIYSQETALDCMVDVAIGVAGSFAGNTMALKAKSWIYELWSCNNPIMTCEKVHLI